MYGYQKVLNSLYKVGPKITSHLEGEENNIFLLPMQLKLVMMLPYCFLSSQYMTLNRSGVPDKNKVGSSIVFLD